MRQPGLTGVYFHAAPTLLDKQLKECFSSPKGPGDLPVKPKGDSKAKTMGVIVPMFQYDLAGPCAAWAYKDLIEEYIPDLYIIIGQSDRGTGLTTEPYETPYGIVRIDQKFAKMLTDKKTVLENNALFDDNDVVESQLPFLQFINPNKMEGIKVLPILVSGDAQLKKLAVDIKEAILESGKKIALVVPSNFTSYGRNHGYVPFGEVDAYKNVYALDKGALDLIEQNNPHDFLKYVDEKGMNMTNYLGIVLALLIIKPKKVLLEQYYTTADLNKDRKNFTGFAAMLMK